MILASMKNFETLRKDWVELHEAAVRVSSSFGLGTHPALKRRQISSYWLIQSSTQFIELLEKESTNMGFKTQRWWGFGCHSMPFFKDIRYVDLLKTEEIAKSTIALPFSIFLGKKDFGILHSALANLVNR